MQSNKGAVNFLWESVEAEEVTELQRKASDDGQPLVDGVFPIGSDDEMGNKSGGGEETCQVRIS